jgi:hypothetical protein
MSVPKRYVNFHFSMLCYENLFEYKVFWNKYPKKTAFNFIALLETKKIKFYEIVFHNKSFGYSVYVEIKSYKELFFLGTYSRTLCIQINFRNIT